MPSIKSTKPISTPEEIEKAFRRATRVLKSEVTLTKENVAKRASMFVTQGADALLVRLRAMSDDDLIKLGFPDESAASNASTLKIRPRRVHRLCKFQLHR